MLHKQGDVHGAIAIYRDVLTRFPEDAELLYHLGSAELTAGNLDHAKRRLTKSVRMKPTAGACRALAKVHDLSGEADAALEQIERGLALAPRDPALVGAKADALFVKGDVEAAHALVTPLVGGAKVHAAVINAFTRLCHRVGRTADGVALIERHIEGASPQEQAVLAFRLAELLDRLGEHDRAFAAAARANGLRRFQFDAGAFEARVERTIGAWTREAIEALPTPTGDTSRPIFIVGMPRSGTSLAERIIANHSQVAAGGERAELARIAVDLGAEAAAPPILESPASLTSGAISRASRRYLNDLRKHDRRASRVTDKMPTNFLNVGLAGAIVPGAAFVHCTRDARDTCLSCYFQSFSEGLPFAADLGDLGAVQNAERRLMAHWKRVIGVPVFDLVYEELVEDVPGVSRRLIEFLGLEFEPACETPWVGAGVSATASIDQVRRPVYTTSVGRWRHYEQHLGALLDGLDSASLTG